MAKDEQQVTTWVATGSPYQLDRNQVYRASLALSKHLENFKDAAKRSKKRKANLLDDDGEGKGEAEPIWLIVTAKKHIHDSNRLKPGTIPIPHPFLTAENTRICLITPDPPAASPRAYKDLLQHPNFPADLAASIPKVMKVSSLRAKYKSFESLRKLHAEYDVFLADERIIHMLPQILGKVFYKTTTKRPIPVSLTGKESWGKKKKEKPKVYKITTKEKGARGPDTVGKPQDVAADIKKALGSTFVHLSQSPTTAVKVARSGWKPDMVADNVEAVVEGLVERFIPKKWRNVRSIHMKGPNTASLPIWLAEEIWQGEEDIVDEVEDTTAGTIEGKKSSKKDRKNKRKQEEDTEEADNKQRKEKVRKLKHDAKRGTNEEEQNVTHNEARTPTKAGFDIKNWEWTI